MLSRKYFRDFSEGATVIEVIGALKQLPPKAKFTCLGDPRFYIHGEEDGSEVWIDDNPMDDLYTEYDNNENHISVKFIDGPKTIDEIQTIINDRQKLDDSNAVIVDSLSGLEIICEKYRGYNSPIQSISRNMDKNKDKNIHSIYDKVIGLNAYMNKDKEN